MTVFVEQSLALPMSAKHITKQTEKSTIMIDVCREQLNSKMEGRQPNKAKTSVTSGGTELAEGVVLSCPKAGSQHTQGNGAPTPPRPHL